MGRNGAGQVTNTHSRKGMYEGAIVAGLQFKFCQVVLCPWLNWSLPLLK